jgi:hypothetical protein
VRLRVVLSLVGLAAAVAAVLVSIFLVRNALADGDPASDYLIGEQLFPSFEASSSGTDVTRLKGMLDDSKRKGFPLKVAVIAGRSDLGSVPSLFGKPEQYARFLGQEDFYFFKDELLVVMPQGYGLYKHGGVPPGDRAAIAKLPAPSTAAIEPLLAAAARAVTALAERRGLSLASETSAGANAWRDRVEIVAGVLVLCAVALGVRVLVRRGSR